ncbi:hypothetical protein [Halorubrum vacuolatum]|uniref:hypothetical protein n=1 Tax=Halorubrum vacuolatum TaxID=63740 RepID=UPI001C527646|nr:hypothetical protein [Halorubrum vacuolatum]
MPHAAHIGFTFREGRLSEIRVGMAGECSRQVQRKFVSPVPCEDFFTTAYRENTIRLGIYDPLSAMSERTTAKSKTVEYETSVCVHCSDEVFIDNDIDNIDNLPRGTPVFVGGGNHISVDQTSPVAHARNYRTPKVIVKWFLGKKKSPLEQQYLCKSCAKAVYNFPE